MTRIFKSRREWFGGVIYSEQPGFTAFVDSDYADQLGIPARDDLSEGLFSAPLDVHMSITHRCNLRCRGCYALHPIPADCPHSSGTQGKASDGPIITAAEMGPFSSHPDEPGRDMPLDLARAILDRLAAMDVLTVALGGGEPFLHKRLFEIAEYARSLNIVPNVTTNGLVMDPARAAHCRVFGSVHVSCHHAAELPRIADAVRLLKAAGIDVGLNVLVSRATYAELPRIWAWCAKQRISRILLLKFKLTANNRDCGDLVLPAPEEQALVPQMRRWARRYSVMPMLDCALFPALAHSNPKRRDLAFFDVNGCVGGNAVLAVTADGRFKPCSFCPTSFGDVLALDPERWKRDTALAAFRRIRTHPSCGECPYGDFCNGGCRFCPTPWCGDEELPEQHFN